jgi:hypothetical protein
MTVRRIAVTGVGAVLAGILLLVIVNAMLAASRDHAVDGERLAAADLALVAEAQRVRARHGDTVWPGFAAADVGLLVFNDRFEFLVGDVSSGWERVEGGAVAYGRRMASDPQAFAVDVGTTWAGSLPTEERMDRDYVRGMRQELPPVAAQLFPVWLLDITPDQWVVSMVHEQFHALQATVAPQRFADARAAYQHENEYPYDDGAFAAAWDAEGSALSVALQADTDEQACDAVGRFAEARETRRKAAGLPAELVAYERDLEWLEGLGKYAEIRTYEAAAAEPGGTARGYRDGLPYWQGELGRLASGLGSLGSDFRFYLSGMAQARLLERLDEKGAWRASLGGLELEGALVEACAGGR